MKLLVLFLQYDTDKYPGAYDRMRSLVARIKGVDWVFFRIDNKLPFSGVTSNGGSAYSLGGDNSCWEFSGWKLSLEQAKAIIPEYDGVLFVNDAFEANKESFLAHIKGAYIEQMLRLNIPIGCTARTKAPFLLMGRPIRFWMRSNCFILARSCAEAVNLVSVDEEGINMFIDTQYEGRYFKEDAPIQEEFRNLIVRWLSKEWHSAFRLEDNWTLFRNKTRSILNEYLLSEQLVQHSLVVFDHRSRPRHGTWRIFRALVAKAFGAF